MQQIQQLERDKRQAERERDQAIQLLKEKDLERVNQQLEESEHLVDHELILADKLQSLSDSTER